jgi:hypothetical protein
VFTRHRLKRGTYYVLKECLLTSVTHIARSVLCVRARARPLEVLKTLLHFVLCFCRRCCKQRARERERERELVEEFGKRRRRSFFCVFCVLLCVSVGVVAQREREREGIWKNENKKYGRRSCGFLFFCEGVGK